VRPPSLYKHIDGMPGLRRGITLRAKADLARVLGQAAIGRARDDAIASVSHAYRAWAEQHPSQYALAMAAPAVGDAEDAEVSSAVMNIIVSALGGYDLADEDLVDAIRFLRSALHGFVLLETSDAFQLPVDLEHSFTRVVESITTSLTNWSRS